LGACHAGLALHPPVRGADTRRRQRMATTYRMIVDGAPRTVQVRDDGGRLTVSIDGEPLDAELRRIDGALYSLLLAGQSFEAVAVEEAFGYEVAIEHEIFDVEIERSDVPRVAAARPSAVAGAGPTEVKAPLTGTVIE